MTVVHNELVGVLTGRIVALVDKLMLTNNECVYLDNPVAVSFKRDERSRITPEVMNAIVSKRVRIRHCVVANVEMADISRSQILVTLRKAHV